MQDLLIAATSEVKPPPPSMAGLVAKPAEPSEFFFTYGTLMRGELFHTTLEREIFEGEAYVTGAKLWDTGYGFPAMTLSLSGGKVWGEVYRIRHPELWARLDQIEAGLYRRIALQVHIPGKAVATRSVSAQVYVAGPWLLETSQHRGVSLREIEGGRWREDADAS